MNAAQYRKEQNRQKGECTWCGGAVPKGRQTFCGGRCVDAFRLTYDWPYVRRAVEKRDGGICRHCGFDTEKLRRILLHAGWAVMEDVCRLLGLVRERSFWEADHIVPRIRGGGDELENLRTLCVPCHKNETATLAGELAAERQDAARPLLCD